MVCQLFFPGGRLRDAAEEGRDEAQGPPDQLAQVHGHLPEAAHVLLALRGFHLVSLSEMCPLQKNTNGQGRRYVEPRSSISGEGKHSIAGLQN